MISLTVSLNSISQLGRISTETQSLTVKVQVGTMLWKAMLFMLTITTTKMSSNEKVLYYLTITVTTTKKSPRMINTGWAKKTDCFLKVWNPHICWHRIAFYTKIVQRIFKYSDMQYTILTPDKTLNSLIYRSLFYLNIYGSYKLTKTVRFLAHPV